MDGDVVAFLKRRYRLWMSRSFDGEIRSGCFAEDARGRWYLNLQIEVVERQDCGRGEIGIDLGLNTLATLSTGEKIEAQLAVAARAGRRRRLRAIHAKRFTTQVCSGCRAVSAPKVSQALE